MNPQLEQEERQQRDALNLMHRLLQHFPRAPAELWSWISPFEIPWRLDKHPLKVWFERTGLQIDLTLNNRPLAPSIALLLDVRICSVYEVLRSPFIHEERLHNRAIKVRGETECWSQTATNGNTEPEWSLYSRAVPTRSSPDTPLLSV